ncbi:3-dehydroquinate synthase [Sphingomonas alba]|uniref:3-dehydroquinate synthase n=1 Tax=Sphingomonas alba TaxID=2908208 RepID=A0ABT0RNU4_9SPHN|nr:3-dehydroquinate synthase [Sphingomonas alba]MCL6684324.1 3-dehydroquinate synthase [Sphingomonas alba]
MSTIRVAHCDADYDVLVENIAEAVPKLAGIANGRRLALVSDTRVFELYGRAFASVALDEPVLVPAGEAAKDWSVLAEITDRLAALDVKRGTPIIALGGGSVGDVAGLAASIFKRGCPIIHVPTTLLAQVDSAIGGKTAIDAAGQKNLVGSFHHPLLVIADPALLDTLDERQMRSGYAEVVKYGLIDDRGLFEWCEANGGAVIAGAGTARRAAIEHCIRAKARFVSADPEDTLGTRALLNLGHTFGHAIEALAGQNLLHGEAVAIGMVLAFEFSAELGLCPADDTERVKTHLRSAGLPVRIADVGLIGPAIFAAMRADKKWTAAGPTLILAKGIGQVFVARDVDASRLAAFLA